MVVRIGKNEVYLTMSYTLEQLTALENAIAQGATEVQYADKRVTYRSLDEMNRIRQQMREELGLVRPVSSRRTYAEFSKGFD